MEAPRDVSDLLLARVLLGVDAQLQNLGALKDEHLALDIILDANEEPQSSADRVAFLIHRIGENVHLHGWDLAINHRGLEVSHSGRSVTVGLPPNLRRYLEGASG